MSQRALEQRVADLERKVAELEAAMANGTQKKAWRRTIGMFSGDEVMKQIGAEALKYREKDR
jgi:hypothetical protein